MTFKTTATPATAHHHAAAPTRTSRACRATRAILLALTLAIPLAGCALDDFTTINTGNEQANDVLSGIRAGGKVIQAGQGMSPQEEYYLGRAVAAQLLEKYKLLHDENATRYINLVGQSISLQSENAPYAGYRFAILDDEQPNAFAAPGAYIFITRGMIRLIETEDQLAAVLAHEIGHVEAKHAVKAVKAQRLTQASLEAGHEAARQAGGDVAQLQNEFGSAVSDVTELLVTTGYSRQQEKQADLRAASLLASAGYDVQALTAVLQKLQQPSAGLAAITHTHPGADERITALQRSSAATFSNIINTPARQARFDHAFAALRN